MRDPRATQLAESVVRQSCRLKAGENILIEVFGSGIELAEEFIEAAYRVGGRPFFQARVPTLWRAWLRDATDEQLALQAQNDEALMKQMDCYVAVRAWDNVAEYADVPQHRMAAHDKIYHTPVHSFARVKGTRWCVMRYPNSAMAQLAGMSTREFEDFYFRVCTVDYALMGDAMEALKELMQATDRVHIKGPGTDLRFSIKDIPAIPCAGQNNIPDGEVFTAPVRTSVNGVVQFNTPSPYDGFIYENVRLRFEEGRIVEVSANDPERARHVFDTDEGARYVGEFSIGLNPYIREPMKDILFDEKIDGSFHFTPGNCYDEAPNGNESAIHWDLVCIQRPEYGGGEIWFDDRLIRKDGRFVVPELLLLNPEKLV